MVAICCHIICEIKRCELWSFGALELGIAVISLGSADILIWEGTTAPVLGPLWRALCIVFCFSKPPSLYPCHGANVANDHADHVAVCFISMVVVLGENTANLEVNEVIGNIKEKGGGFSSDSGPSLLCIDASFQSLGRFAEFLPRWRIRRLWKVSVMGLVYISGEESESLLIEEFMEHMEHSDPQVSQEQGWASQTNWTPSGSWWSWWSQHRLVRLGCWCCRSLLLATVLHLAWLGYSQYSVFKNSTVSPREWSGWNWWRWICTLTKLHVGNEADGPCFSCSALHVAACRCQPCRDASPVGEHRCDGRESGCERRWMAWDETPLHMAVRRGSIAACELLLEAKADVNARNADDETPLAVLNKATDAKKDAKSQNDFDNLVTLSHLLFSHGAVLVWLLDVDARHSAANALRHGTAGVAAGDAEWCNVTRRAVQDVHQTHCDLHVCRIVAGYASSAKKRITALLRLRFSWASHFLVFFRFLDFHMCLQWFKAFEQVAFWIILARCVWCYIRIMYFHMVLFIFNDVFLSNPRHYNLTDSNGKVLLTAKPFESYILSYFATPETA